MSIRSWPLIAVLGTMALLLALAASPVFGDGRGPHDLETLHGKIFPLFGIEGVVYTDANETTGLLEVGISRPAAASEVARALDRLGVARSSVDIVASQPIVRMETLRDRVRPLQGGLQIAFDVYVCTLGFNGVRNGVEGIVTNSHCTSQQGGVEGTQHYQPSVSGGNFIATEIADPEYSKDNCPSNFRGKKCRYSDSAYSQLDSANVSADLGVLKRTDGVNNGSLNVAGTFRITDVAPSNAATGTVVNKVGRTTGWTQGQVSNSCANVGVTGSNIVQLCQDIVTSPDTVIADGGDSGSPVFVVTNSPNQHDVTLYGILWGGSTDGQTLVYSPMANVQRSDELGPITVMTPPDSTDIAVTSVTAPASVVQGSSTDVDVTVKNVGTNDVTSDINVTLNDDTDAVVIGSQTIVGGLASGAVVILTYSWDTSTASMGDHTLTATQDFTDDNAANDSGSTVVTVENAKTDIAVTAVSAPLGATQGDLVSVDVTVENVGNQDVTSDISVTLNDDTDAVTIGTQTIVGGMAPGASTTLTYSWDTSGASTGDHTLTATQSLADDDASNDSSSTTVSVNAPGAALSVSVTTDKGSYVHGENALITTTVTDGTNPVSGASVQLVVDTANGNRLSCSGTTDSTGVFACNYKVNSRRDGVGTYTATSTASKDGYDPGSGSATFEVNHK